MFLDLRFLLFCNRTHSRRYLFVQPCGDGSEAVDEVVKPPRIEAWFGSTVVTQFEYRKDNRLRIGSINALFP